MGQSLAHAFVLGRGFVGRDAVALVLGDNIFYGHGFSEILCSAKSTTPGATVFGYQVMDPERYGVVNLDESGVPVSIEEKPSIPTSSIAVTGLYFYDNRVLDIAAALVPSTRGELEITDVNRVYLDCGELQVKMLSRGFAWLDTGTNDSLLDACNFVAAVEKRQGLKIACPEEIAFRKGFITRAHLIDLANDMANGYGEYLLQCADQIAPPEKV